MSAIDDYLRHLTRTNYRPATITQTGYCLRRVQRRAGVPLLEMTPQQADDWYRP